MPRTVVCTDGPQAKQQQKGSNNAEEKSEPVLPARTAASSAEAGQKSSSAEQSKDRNAIDVFLAWILDAKSTDVAIMIFTGILAWRTHGLFVETGALRAAATEQSRLLTRSIDETAKTADAALEANILARDIFSAENRPWISIELTPADDFRVDANGALIASVNLIFKNHGKTPATGIFFKMKIINDEIGLIDKTHNEMVNDLSKYTGRNNNGFSIFPGGILEEYREFVFFRSGAKPSGNLDWDEYIKAHLVGCIDYAFPFGGQGRTKFCFSLAKKLKAI
ncbi:hypothetical protein GCM10011611_42130 [Aliidongia dinghuensis]|uniref:Uncharacterized protein n=2 Tax=Aliidongia dinghuensis TaxID=1867774 RepID=A0A8J2YWA9_9PROT|nr:hypothetical protein GCM10011611_42130 [Aliidongia dinghuensis]